MIVPEFERASDIDGALGLPIYRAAEKRDGALPFSTKIFQALGAVPIALKDWAFSAFLLLFYNQVLGVPASWAALALMAGVIVDAVTDPIVGSLSDGLKSRWGRRHPLMYASVAPLAVSLFMVFNPPAGLSQAELTVWLAVFCVLSRVAMTFFAVPWSAIFAELTSDYVERSEVLAIRYGTGIVAVALFTAFTWAFIFSKTAEYPVGQLNPAGYESFALVLAALVGASALLAGVLTHREVRFFRQPTEQVAFNAKRVISEIRAALGSRNFTVLFVGLLISHALTGTLEALRIYFATYFWGLTPEDLQWFALAGFGALSGLFCASWLNKRFDKKALLVWAMTASIVDGAALVSLRFAGLLPDNGEPALLTILVANECFRAFLLVIIGTMFFSMVADTIDEQELRTGLRQEGVFAAGIGLSSKAVSGVGILLAGLILEYLVGFPRDTRPDVIPEGPLMRLGMVMGYAIPLLYAVPLLLLRRYSLSRTEHQRVLDRLQAPEDA